MATSWTCALSRRLIILAIVHVVLFGTTTAGSEQKSETSPAIFRVSMKLSIAKDGFSHLRVDVSCGFKTPLLLSRSTYGQLHFTIFSICFTACCYLSIVILVLLLLLSGDVELNPGPIRFPCGKCNKPVKNNQKGLQCNRCDVWYHAKCELVSNNVYDLLSNTNNEWFCGYCSLPPLSDSFFLPSTSSNSSVSTSPESSICLDESTCNLPPPGPPGLLIVHLNIRSLLYHLDELHQPDIVAVSETWLDSTVHNEELSIVAWLQLVSS